MTSASGTDGGRPAERFTMLEEKEPRNLTPEQQQYPVVEGVHGERFTMLDATRATADAASSPDRSPPASD